MNEKTKKSIKGLSAFILSALAFTAIAYGLYAKTDIIILLVIAIGFWLALLSMTLVACIFWLIEYIKTH